MIGHCCGACPVHGRRLPVEHALSAVLRGAKAGAKRHRRPHIIIPSDVVLPINRDLGAEFMPRNHLVVPHRLTRQDQTRGDLSQRRQKAHAASSAPDPSGVFDGRDA